MSEWVGRKHNTDGACYPPFEIMTDDGKTLHAYNDAVATDVRRKLNFCEGIEFVVNKVGGLEELLDAAEDLRSEVDGYLTDEGIEDERLEERLDAMLMTLAPFRKEKQ